MFFYKETFILSFIITSSPQQPAINQHLNDSTSHYPNIRIALFIYLNSDLKHSHVSLKMYSRHSKVVALLGAAIVGFTSTAIAQFSTSDGFSCQQSPSGNFSNTLTTSVIASSGKMLRATIDYTDKDITYTIKHGDDLVYSKHSTGAPDNVTMDITFGPNTYKGISQMSTIYNRNDQTLVGTIDGRQIATYKRSLAKESPKMADGRPAPTANMIANLTADDILAINNKIKSTEVTCGKATTFPKPSRDLENLDLFPRGYVFSKS